MLRFFDRYAFYLSDKEIICVVLKFFEGDIFLVIIKKKMSDLLKMDGLINISKIY